jgi:transposase
VWRARIVLLSADRVGTMAIQRQTGKGKPTIWRWQARFMVEGVDGRLRDATRPGRKKPLAVAMIERVAAMSLADPPGEATHRTGRAMAKAAGISHRSVQRIWAAHGLQPHRVRLFKLSNDTAFATKAQDIAGRGGCPGARPGGRSAGARAGAFGRREEPDPEPAPGMNRGA